MGSILIIDDNIEIRKLLRELLEREKYQVFEASEGDEGINICRRQKIDLVITDLVMPGKEGIETIIELKHDFPDINIIALSGGGKIGPRIYLEYAEIFGADHSFSKPISPRKLLAAVNELVSM